MPDAGKGAGTQGRQQAHELATQGEGIGRHQAHHKSPVPARGGGGDAGFDKGGTGGGQRILGPLRDKDNGAERAGAG